MVRRERDAPVVLLTKSDIAMTEQSKIAHRHRLPIRIYATYQSEEDLHKTDTMLAILTFFALLAPIVCERQTPPPYPYWPTGFK